jgi:predicted DCC family thiol-disulfide oxidoreductase YuxK
VRFVLWADRGGSLRFAPLGGETFLRLVPAEEREGLPDSLVLRTSEGRLRTRSVAVVQTLRILGGPWRLLAALVALVPRALADAFYDGVARIRYRLFARPPDVCPVVPAALRSRFDP